MNTSPLKEITIVVLTSHVKVCSTEHLDNNQVLTQGLYHLELKGNKFEQDRPLLVAKDTTLGMCAESWLAAEERGEIKVDSGRESLEKLALQPASD